jgi:rRNA maturation endonuclease Nob1
LKSPACISTGYTHPHKLMGTRARYTALAHPLSLRVVHGHLVLDDRQECFGCAGCGRKLERSCLNIGDKPYCDSCGKQAFIRHTLAK